jgi:hypothetical protein
MGPCSQCVHFRHARPASQLLSAVISLKAGGAEVTNAVAKIVDDENKVREAEVDTKAKESDAERVVWPMRPLMSDYCGKRESEEIFQIHEIKNRGLGCLEFEGGKPERRACSDCAHRVAAAGPGEDANAEQLYGNMIVSAIGAQASPQTAQGLLQSHRGGVTARKALEIAGAYAAKGLVLTKPVYLDHCASLSTPDEFVICALANSHSTCAAHEPAT